MLGKKEEIKKRSPKKCVNRKYRDRACLGEFTPLRQIDGQKRWISVQGISDQFNHTHLFATGFQFCSVSKMPDHGTKKKNIFNKLMYMNLIDCILFRVKNDTVQIRKLFVQKTGVLLWMISKDYSPISNPVSLAQPRDCTMSFHLSLGSQFAGKFHLSVDQRRRGQFRRII